MSDTTTQKRAVWTPGWYEMDQSIAVGVRQKFWFFQERPPFGTSPDDIDLVFFNQLDSECKSQIRFVQIAGIDHDLLGPLVRIDTDGLDYIFVPIEGDEIFVNAEEEPGTSYNSDCQIDNWSVIVTLTEVSDPICEIV